MNILEGEQIFLKGSNLPTESINLIPVLEEQKGKDWTNGLLSKMSSECIANYNNDLASRAEWEKIATRSLKLFTSNVDPKNFPWKNCSNINLPFITIACLQFHARAYDALINPRGTVGVTYTGMEDKEKADRVRRYMDYQILYQMKEFEEGMDKTLLSLPIVGCNFRKTYYDAVKRRVVSSFVPAGDLVVQYNYKVSIDEVERKTHVIYMSNNDCKIRAKKGIFIEKAFDLGTPMIIPRSDLRTEMDKIHGFTQGYTNDTRVILEQHTLYDIDGDDIAEPYIITIDLSTGTVLRITDRRFINSQGVVQRMEYFTKFGFIPNIEGFYDLGLGILLLGINEAGNTIVNEVIDAGALANIQGGFVSKRSGIKRGNLSFQMGEYKEVDTYAEDLSKAILHLDFKGPNQTLYAVLGLLYEYSKLVSSVSEVMTGQLPASDTPASSVLSILEEGRKVFSSIHKRIHRAFKQELLKIFTLNSIYLDEMEYFSVLGEKGLPEGQISSIGRSDFSNTIDVFPVSDPALVSKAEILMKAEKSYQLVMNNPLTANNPELVTMTLKKVLNALSEHDVANEIKPPPPPPPPPDLPPQQENAMMITEKGVQALPHQDHMNHISVHKDLREGIFAPELTSVANRLLNQHILEHMSFLYLNYSMAKGGDLRVSYG